MLGLGTGKGGQSSNQQVQGQQMPNIGGGGLAALFANNAPASGGGMAAPMPQIMAPQRPQIQMPVGRPMPQPQQPAQSPAMSLRERMLTGWKNYNELDPVQRSRMRHPNR